MFKCPVCHHATFNYFQYTIKSGVSTVECSNCHTVLHQPPRSGRCQRLNDTVDGWARHVRWRPVGHRSRPLRVLGKLDRAIQDENGHNRWPVCGNHSCGRTNPIGRPGALAGFISARMAARISLIARS